jgi:hypothetical protein
MRSKDEIRAGLAANRYNVDSAILEVLFDIRDLLTGIDEKSKEIHISVTGTPESGKVLARKIRDIFASEQRNITR